MQEIEINQFCEQLTTFNYKNFSVKVLNYGTIEYKDFFENFMNRNLPCIVKNVSETWECSKKWIKNDKINVEYLTKTYGDMEAPVVDCDIITYNAQDKGTMKVSDFMSYLEDDIKENLLYLKDWHLRRLRPNDNFYEVPFLFGSDWLNEYATDNKEDDFMFVYIGPKNSWTPFHADVYSSYSWSVNVVGKKKWFLFPPGEELKLTDSLENLPVLFDPTKYENVEYVEIIQEKGDAIFVPSGWYHQVVNLEDTISINHNWINACNLHMAWSSLQKTLTRVEHEIQEFKDTPEYASQCQLILKTFHGTDFATFVNFLCYLAKKRLCQLEGKNLVGFNNFRLGINHIKFDLNVIFKIINLIHNHPLPINAYLSPNSKLDFINTKNSIVSSLELNKPDL